MDTPFDIDWLNAHISDPETSDAIEVCPWKSPGPVSTAFIESRAKIKTLAGGFGAGKTSTVLNGEVFEAMRSPRCIDGVRRYSLLVLRDSYRQLYKTAVRTWNSWYPQSIGSWNGTGDRPAEHKLVFADEYGLIKMHVMFVAIPEMDIRAFMDGFEMTSIFMNAADSLPKEVLTYGVGRIGRDPPIKMLPKGAQMYSHVSMDINKTDTEHWQYEFNIENPSPDVQLFDMPGQMEPDAENVENVPADYYDTMLANNPKWWTDIFVHNNWGASRHGEPVYPEFNDRDHVAREDFDANPDLPLILCLDAGTVMGGRPSAVFLQVTPSANVRVVDELYIGRAGPTRFFEGVNAKLDEPHLREARHNMRMFIDPSAFAGADSDGGEKNWTELAQIALGVRPEMPESNELEGFRLETTRVLLNKRDSGVMGYLLSPRCKLNRKGKNSGYQYGKKETKEGVSETPKPVKTGKAGEYTHVQDAEQHGLTGYFGRSLIEGRMRQAKNNSTPAGHVSQGFDADFDLDDF